MIKKSTFTEIVGILKKDAAPKLKGEIISDEEDHLVVKTGAGVFRVARSFISKDERTEEGVELTLESDSKLVRESLVDLAAGVGAITPEVFGPGGIGGIVARDCDCRCQCECRCDCDCRCLCSDEMLTQVLSQAQQLAKFGQLNVNIVGRVITKKG